MSKNELIIRQSSELDKNYLYKLLEDGVLGIVDYGSITYKTLHLLISEYNEKLGKFKFIISNLIIFILIHLIVLKLQFNRSIIITLILFLLSCLIFINSILKYTLNQYKLYYRNSIETDYKDINSWLFDGKSNLWVACLNESIVGSIGICQFKDENRLPFSVKSKLKLEIIELKRMYVFKNFRGLGIASKLLVNLENWCKKYKYKQIILSTTSYQIEAINFYQKNGFNLIYKFNLSFWFPQIYYLIKEI